jgi:hypothetical protein
LGTVQDRPDSSSAMKASTIVIAAALASAPVAALACPPPPPGWVEPTHEQLLERSLKGATEIVYGVITRSAEAGEPAAFKVLHVYRGSARKGDTIVAPVGWGHPVPYCVGMMGAAPPRPQGAYGVIAFARHAPILEFIKPDDVQLMIRRGWIKSARAR